MTQTTSLCDSLLSSTQVLKRIALFTKANIIIQQTKTTQPTIPLHSHHIRTTSKNFQRPQINQNPPQHKPAIEPLRSLPAHTKHPKKTTIALRTSQSSLRLITVKSVHRRPQPRRPINCGRKFAFVCGAGTVARARQLIADNLHCGPV